MKKQVAVFGLGRFGSSMAETLSRIGYEVVAVDVDNERVQEVASKVSQAIQGDATDEGFLKKIDASNFDVAVVAIGTDLESSVLCTLLAKSMNIPYVIARAENNVHASILTKIGADKVVYPEHQMGSRLAHLLSLQDAQDYIPVLYRYGVAKMAAMPCFIGRTVSQLGFGRKGEWGVVILLILRSGEAIVNPADIEVIKSGDILVTAGEDDKLEGLIAAAKKAENSQGQAKS
jgi:trk system potassium uptake protein TrkA